jgi:hypothetical protein
MADKDDKSILFKIIALCLFISTMYLMLFIDSNTYSNIINQEIEANFDLMGEDNGAVAKLRADDIYAWVVTDSGFEGVLFSLVSENKGESVIVELTNDTDKYIIKFVNNVRTFFYQVSYRLSNLISWLYIFIPFLVFTVIDGYYTWKIKQFSFGKTEQKKYSAWKKLTTAKAIGLMCYMLIPAFYSTGLALLSPIAIFLIAITTNRTIRHYQKISG